MVFSQACQQELGSADEAGANLAHISGNDPWAFGPYLPDV